MNTIRCIHCGKNIEISEALSHELRASYEAEYQKKLSEAQKETEEKLKKELLEKSSLEMDDLKKQLEEKNQKVGELREQEIKLRDEKRKLEEREKEMALELERKMDEERKKIEEKIIREETEKQRLKEAQKDKVINDLRIALEDAQRKATQGSQQLQGEVLELDLELMLRENFPTDDIVPVEKGVRGADVRQIVRTAHGNTCGVVLWETKRTKAWSDGWVTKLKDDLRAEKANIPIIVSSVLPNEAESGFGMKDGVWIVSFPLIVPFARMVRDKLIEVAREKFLSQSKEGRAEQLYSYIISHEFRQQIEAMLEEYKSMKDQIDRERRAFEKIWSTREVQLDRMFRSTARIVGGIQGTVGSSMTQIKGLELLELEDGN